MSDVDLAVKFFLQLGVILAACKTLGWIGQRFFGQTQVVMEMVAGVLLGPSLFGALLPSAQNWLFPALIEGSTAKHPSMGVLYVVAQLGLVLYMFLIGLEFDLDLVRQRVRGAISVSLAGICLPFVLGVAVAVGMHRQGDFFGKGVSVGQGALYLGAAMCITAFPMLARIISERGLSGTAMGALALAAGAVDDVAAWCVLAIVLASFKSEPAIAFASIGGGIFYASVLLTFGRTSFKKFEDAVVKERKLTASVAGTALTILLLCAWFTDAIGIYAVFGAFICGASMPRGKFAEGMKASLQTMTTSLLLPVFFVYSGLNTSVQLIDSGPAFFFALAAIGAAIAGKWGGCTLAAKASGESWSDSNKIGILMNARGLMELIILNIGLQHGVITPTLFTVMVLMALVTTLMASPLFLWFDRRSRRAAVA